MVLKSRLKTVNEPCRQQINPVVSDLEHLEPHASPERLGKFVLQTATIIKLKIGRAFKCSGGTDSAGDLRIVPGKSQIDNDAKRIGDRDSAHQPYGERVHFLGTRRC